MPPAATMWIRDGVLVNRMHVNPVAFAYSYWVFTPPEKRTSHSIEMLINFGFEKSGIACAEKMNLFNEERRGGLVDVASAAAFYNDLATEAAESCGYFAGMPELLSEQHGLGVKNYITSAVQQQVLDNWRESSQGSSIAQSLAEILGARDGFTKGRDHFDYVRKNVSGGQIFYIADAVSEISAAKAISKEFNIVPIGFGYVVGQQAVMDAVQLIKNGLSGARAAKAPYPDLHDQIDPKRLVLADEMEVEESLRQAGAAVVVKGTEQTIALNLRTVLLT